MTKILAFDSTYIVNPIRFLYLALIKKIFRQKDNTCNRLVLYRLDKNNVFLENDENISGGEVKFHQSQIDALGLKFYRHIENSEEINLLKIKNISLYKLYTRQVKLKLMGLIKCAARIEKLSGETKGNLEIISDRQTVSMIEETFDFLDFKKTNIRWKTNSYLTACISINSFFMRLASVSRMMIYPSDLPKYYFHKVTNSSFPTVLITLPKRRPYDFFKTYVEDFEKQFNVILYSLGKINSPQGYKRKKVKRSKKFLRGLFKIKNFYGTKNSYIEDILLIFKKQSNLNLSIDVGDSIFLNKIDAHVSRLQTNVLDNYLAIKAKKKGVFILGDLMEEIFYCDAAVCSSKSEITESLKLSLPSKNKIIFKGSNSLIKYRLENYSQKKANYLHQLIGLDANQKIIFYASDPSKDESQRYLTEKFLIDFFSNSKEYIFVIKTHPQDNGKITNHAYLKSKKSTNIFLVGDEAQENKMASNKFIIEDNFNFNSAIDSCDGFLTFSSSSILQALMLGVKTGIVDQFNNGFYDYLVDFKASFLIKDKESLNFFLKSKKLDLSDNVLNFFGLRKDDKEFNLRNHLLNCLSEIDSNNVNKTK